MCPEEEDIHIPLVRKKERERGREGKQHGSHVLICILREISNASLWWWFCRIESWFVNLRREKTRSQFSPFDALNCFICCYE
jgi:hypothetical protein